MVVSDRVTTPSRDPWSALIGLIRRVLAAASDIRIVGCGVGCGGPMARGGVTVSPLHIPSWREFPLLETLSEAIRDAVEGPIVIDNDAKAFTLGQGWRGKAAGRTDYMGVIIGTGVGAGIVVDGHLLHGETSNAGHIGHVVVEPDGIDCRCGGRGCLEAYLSGTAIERETGRSAQYASALVRERNAQFLGRALASAAALTSVDMIVLGGSVAIGWGEPFWRRVAEEFASRSRLSFTQGVDIVGAEPGDRSPLVGAAALVIPALDQVGPRSASASNRPRVVDE